MAVQWKREHRQALLLAVGAGAAFGLVHGVEVSPAIWNPNSCNAFLGTLLHGICPGPLSDWLPLLGWPAFGGALGGAAILVWRLMLR